MLVMRQIDRENETTYHHPISEIVNTDKRARFFASLKKKQYTYTKQPSAEQYDWQGRTCEVKQLDASRTIRPTKEHTKGSTDTLHQKISTLKRVKDFRTLARLPADRITTNGLQSM